MLENLTAVCPLGIKIRMDWLAKRFWLATLRELLICVLMMVDIPKPSCCLSVEERSYSKKLSRNTYLSKRTAFQWWVNADFVLFFLVGQTTSWANVPPIYSWYLQWWPRIGEILSKAVIWTTGRRLSLLCSLTLTQKISPACVVSRFVPADYSCWDLPLLHCSLRFIYSVDNLTHILPLAIFFFVIFICRYPWRPVGEWKDGEVLPASLPVLHLLWEHWEASGVLDVT